MIYHTKGGLVPPGRVVCASGTHAVVAGDGDRVYWGEVNVSPQDNPVCAKGATLILYLILPTHTAHGRPSDANHFELCGIACLIPSD